MLVVLQLRFLQVIAKSLSSKTMALARSSDRRDWPLPPLTWDSPRLGWPDSPQKRTPQKRQYSQRTSERALEGRARCARTETSSTHVECNSEKKEFARRVRVLWSPVFAFSDFDDASTGQFAQCFQRVGSNVVGTSSQPPSRDVGDHKHSLGSPK